MAIREAIKGAAPNDLGTIELTIIGVETIPEGLTPKLGRSISCPAIISPRTSRETTRVYMPR